MNILYKKKEEPDKKIHMRKKEPHTSDREKEEPDINKTRSSNLIQRERSVKNIKHTEKEKLPTELTNCSTLMVLATF